MNELSPEQKEVVESWGRGLGIQAGAGSGKTSTLVRKCVALLERDPEARFAAVSFTERSASDLKIKLGEALSTLPSVRAAGGSPLSRHWVMTIHGLCAAIIGEFPRAAGFDGEETMLSEPESRALWERSVLGLWGDELPPDLEKSVDRLLERESRAGLGTLLGRCRSLSAFGALERMAALDDPASRDLAAIADFVIERYRRLKQRRGVMDFDDLERGADRALGESAVREALHRRFALILVDEFQDTNPVQARLIRALVRPDLSNLVVVGDPKQSIYRFRDADVGVFEEFCGSLPEGKSLTWNFRSRPGILDYANGICAEAFVRSDLAFGALVPKRAPDPEMEPVLRLDVTEPSGLARWIQAERRRGIGLDRMALLLRRIRGNERWLRALTAAGIPIAIGSGGLFWEDPRVRELVSFLRWWEAPESVLSGAVFMRAPWVGVPDELLDQWRVVDPTLRRSFLASDLALARALRPFAGRVARPAELLTALLISDELEAELGAPLLGLWHRAEELSSRGLDFRAVVGELGRAVEEGRRERDVPPPRNQGQLAVLTLHGSKGLEFEHVILLDFGKKPRGGDMPLLFWDRERGAFLGGRDADGDRDRDGAVETEWRDDERRKRLAESKRLFYVALTRARERLVLVCPELEVKAPPARAPSKSAEPPNAYDSDDWRAWIDAYGGEIARASAPPPIAVPARSGRAAAGANPARAGASTERVIAPLDGSLPLFAATRAGRPPERRQRPRHSVTEWTLLSRCARAYEWTFVRPHLEALAEGRAGQDRVTAFATSTDRARRRLTDGARVETQDDGAVSRRELGTRVHACLERGDSDGLRELEAEVGAGRLSAESVIQWAATHEWMRGPDLARGREVWTELEFESAIPTGEAGAAPEILVGSMDRLIREERDGELRLTVVDFKVTGKAGDSEALRESYQVQLDLYVAALRRLEPGVTRVEAALVNIHPGGVQTVRVEARAEVERELAREAVAIVAGARGRPRPGSACRHCAVRAGCDVAQRP